MPYFVVGFGLLMSLVGALSIASGWPVIQVERGWSMVIAGATLVAGGFVTAALGLVLRAVGMLKVAIPTANRGPLPAERPLADPFIPPPPDMPSVAVPVATAALPEHGWDDTRDSETRIHAGDIIAPVEVETYPAGALPQVLAVDSSSYEAMPTEPELAVAEPAAAGPDSAPTEDVAAPADRATTSPAMDDWLDRSFADLDQETAELAKAPTEPELPPQEEAQPALSAPATTRPVEPTAAVIGRYESEGTSYVMYADGSIEAQSPTGVYRFASMAELKAFIES